MKRLYPPLGGKRDPGMMKCYMADLTAFAETYTLKPELQLPKNRFKKYHEFWDGWGSGTASEEFDDRLSEQGTDAENSDGEPTVPTKDNSSRVVRSGFTHGRSASAPPVVRAGKASAAAEQHGGGDRVSRRRDRRRASGSGSPGRTRRRSRSRGGRRRGASRTPRRGRGSGRRPESDDRGDGDGCSSVAGCGGIAASVSSRSGRRRKDFASPNASNGSGGRLPSSSPPSAKSSQATRNASQTQTSLDFNSSKGRKQQKTDPHKPEHQVRSKTQLNRDAPIDVNNDTDDEDDAPFAPAPKGAIGFLAKKAALKKEMDAEFRKRGLKTYAIPALKQVYSKLSEGDKAELAKTGDAASLWKAHDAAIKRLKDLEKELTDVDQDPGLILPNKAL